MTSFRLGLSDDPDIELTIRHVFVKKGSVITPTADVLFVDVGGRLCPGIIDHHQGSPDACSATRLVVRHPEFVFDHMVPGWRNAARSRAASKVKLEILARIATHEKPDLDALLAAYLASELLCFGDFPEQAEELADMADRVDQGRELVVPAVGEAPTLYGVILSLSHELDARVRDQRLQPERRDEEMLGIGFDLIRDWITHKQGWNGGRLAVTPSNSDRPAWLRCRHHIVESALAGLQSDRARFDQLVASGRVFHLDPVRVPGRTATDAMQALPAAAIPRVEECWFNKHFLRAGTDSMPPASLTVIASDSGRPDRQRFVISIDPRGREGSLRGLGAALELRESVKRAQLGLSAERAGPARFPEFPDVQEPWYDGRGHEHTIVDSPNCGSVLDYEEILDVLRSSFWEPEVHEAAVYGFDGNGHCIERKRLHGSCRLDAVRSDVSTARKTRTPSEPDFLLVHCALHAAWGRAPLESLAEFVCGAAPTRLQMGRIEFFIGVRGVLVHGPHDEAIARSVRRQSERVLRLVARLDALGRKLASVDGAERRTSYRGWLGEHVRDVARFHSTRSNELPAELLPFVHELEARLDVESRAEAIGRLLEHVNEDAERRNGVRLNRLVFIVALFGVLETAAALWPDWREPMRWCFALLVISAITSFVRWIQRWYVRIPVLGPMLFDDPPHQERPE